ATPPPTATVPPTVTVREPTASPTPPLPSATFTVVIIAPPLRQAPTATPVRLPPTATAVPLRLPTATATPRPPATATEPPRPQATPTPVIVIESPTVERVTLVRATPTARALSPAVLNQPSATVGSLRPGVSGIDAQAPASTVSPAAAPVAPIQERSAP